jgi:hypothetical protein
VQSANLAVCKIDVRNLIDDLAVLRQVKVPLHLMSIHRVSSVPLGDNRLAPEESGTLKQAGINDLRLPKMLLALSG